MFLFLFFAACIPKERFSFTSCPGEATGNGIKSLQSEGNLLLGELSKERVSQLEDFPLPCLFPLPLEGLQDKLE